MARIYDKAAWRAQPRERCVVHELIGGECRGPVALHHVHHLSFGGDDDGRTVPVCSRHHPMVEALARRVHHWRRCPHQHRTPEAREACERRLNAA
jgi:hypothetical protein